MSAILLGPYSASFGATKIFGPVVNVTDINLLYQVRVATAGALSTALVTFSWVDENGVSYSKVAPMLSLTSLSNLSTDNALVRLGAGEQLDMAATFVNVGGGTFEVLYGRPLI